jgi:hypothetical protein
LQCRGRGCNAWRHARPCRGWTRFGRSGLNHSGRIRHPEPYGYAQAGEPRDVGHDGGTLPGRR